MFKKIIASIAAIATLATPVAMAQSVSTDAAYISADAKLVKQENEGAYIEYEYRDEAANAEIEALADASGKYVIVKTEYVIAPGARESKLDEAAANETAQGILPGCEVDYAYSCLDDGLNEWHAFCLLDGDMWRLTFTADNGDVIETEVIPGAADEAAATPMLSASGAIDALKAAKGNIAITDLDFDFDDDAGIMYYEGECTLDGKKYEFKINAATGDVAEWELDD
ncbi:MAG: PepSY domain-containing protein [Clostridiales bacterium]|nr:PepSY domain-containing protein [Clostridiales bacterium]